MSYEFANRDAVSAIIISTYGITLDDVESILGIDILSWVGDDILRDTEELIVALDKAMAAACPLTEALDWCRLASHDLGDV